MAELERDGWVLKRVSINYIKNPPRLEGFMMKGDDNATPSATCPENIDTMSYAEIVELLWAEKERNY